MPRDGYTTMTISEDALARLNEDQREGESRSAQIKRLTTGSPNPSGENPPPADLADEIAELTTKVERVEDEIQHIPDRVTSELR